MHKCVKKGQASSEIRAWLTWSSILFAFASSLVFYGLSFLLKGKVRSKRSGTSVYCFDASVSSEILAVDVSRSGRAVVAIAPKGNGGMAILILLFLHGTSSSS